VLPIITAYPNPFADYIAIKGLQPSKTYTIELIDITGKRILTRTVQQQSIFNLKDLKLMAGKYFLKLSDKKNNRTIGTIPVVRLK
jgi:hypothetical protein